MRLDLKAIIQKYNPVCRDFFFFFSLFKPQTSESEHILQQYTHNTQGQGLKNEKQKAGVSLWQKVKKNNFLFKMCIVFLFDMDKKCSKIFCSPEGCLPDFNFLLLR